MLGHGVELQAIAGVKPGDARPVAEREDQQEQRHHALEDNQRRPDQSLVALAAVEFDFHLSPAFDRLLDTPCGAHGQEHGTGGRARARPTRGIAKCDRKWLTGTDRGMTRDSETGRP